MKCVELDRILDERTCDRLTREARVAVDRHLRECSRCAPLWRASELLAAESVPGAPPALLDRVLARIDTAAPPAKPAPALERFAIPVGLAATLLIAALALWQPATPVVPSIPPTDGGPADVRAGASADGNATLAATRFVEGRHFMRIEGGPVTTDAEAGVVHVEEFFMYACPHCYTFEGIFDPWCSVQPDYVRVTRVPVVFNPVARLHARAFYAAQLLGIDAGMHPALLAAIHEQGRSMSTELELAGLAARFGVASDAFLDALGSPAVLGLVHDAEQLARRYGIRATPTLVVGREFQVQPGSAGSYEDMIEVTEQLIEAAVEPVAADCPGSGPATACDPVL